MVSALFCQFAHSVSASSLRVPMLRFLLHCACGLRLLLQAGLSAAPRFADFAVVMSQAEMDYYEVESEFSALLLFPSTRRCCVLATSCRVSFSCLTPVVIIC
jgi:hypothetical protein